MTLYEDRSSKVYAGLEYNRPFGLCSRIDSLLNGCGIERGSVPLCTKILHVEAGRTRRRCIERRCKDDQRKDTGHCGSTLMRCTEPRRPEEMGLTSSRSCIWK